MGLSTALRSGRDDACVSGVRRRVGAGLVAGGFAEGVAVVVAA